MTVNELADDLLDAFLTAEPVEASLFGIPGFDDRLPDPTRAAEEEVERRLDRIAGQADHLLGGNGSGPPLSREERITAAFVATVAANARDVLRVRLAEFTIADFFSAPVAGLLYSLPQLTLTSADQAGAYLTRLAGLPEYIDGAVGRFREGLAADRPPVRRLVQHTVEMVDRVLADAGCGGLHLGPPPDWSGAARFTAERDRLIAEAVRPALAGYRKTLAAEFLPVARADERPGLSWLPDGTQAYRACIRDQTSTDRSADELHETGLAIIGGLTAEYAEIGGRLWGTAERQEIFERLRSDAALRFSTGEQMLAAATQAIGRAEAAAGDWFGKLPSGGCAVEPIPDEQAPTAPFAYYQPPALDGGRPGTYFVNTYQPEQRFRHQVAATSYHEAVPGHHFQIALAQQRTELPLARRVTSDTAYVEGWGLYAERLADEMGLYPDDVSRLGMLTADSMRAGRLVVDTGLHALGWSRQQAVDFLEANTPVTSLEISTEVDRYTAAPGQALGYMVGRLELQRIRSAAERRLGALFDIRGFHDAVLGQGALPLGLLADVVDAWAQTVESTSSGEG